MSWNKLLWYVVNDKSMKGEVFMPNYVINSIKMDGPEKDIQAICDLLRNKDSQSDEQIDFNNVVPMPKSMDLVSGGFDRQYVGVYVKSLSVKERDDLAQKLESVPTSFYKNYFNKYKDAFLKDISVAELSRMADRFKEDYKSINPSSIEEVGKTYVDNIINYGADTWYDWCCKNWGTKWGAMSSCIENNLLAFDTAYSAALPITVKLSEMFPDVTFTHEYADEDIGCNCGRYIFKDGKKVVSFLPEKLSNEAVVFACGVWDYDPEEYGVYEVDSVDDVIQEATTQSLSQDNDLSKSEEILEI